jgi:hypothetical protein
MPDIADVIRLHGPEYLRRFGDAMPPSHRRALTDLAGCRTPAMGGRLYVCDHCGRFQYAYLSCRNRACPGCHAKDTHAWLDARQRQLLPVPYFHLVFTVPAHLRERFRSHQQALYPLLLQTAAQALLRLAADPHYLGATPAVLAVLHTWSRTLVYHPHVHLLVCGGGLDADGRWKSARPGFLVPVRALSKLFGGMLLDRIAKALPDVSTPAPPRRQRWVVHCKPAVHGTARVLRYLGRYVHRVALTNARIVSIHNGLVTFGYSPVADGRGKTMTIPALEFLRRFLQHVLPKGFHKVRYYGLWAASNRQRLADLQAALTPDDHQRADPPADPPDRPTFRLHQSPCPACRLGRLVFLRRLARHERAPPGDPIARTRPA